MAIVLKYGTAFQDPAGITSQISATLAEGRKKQINSAISLAVADSIASVYLFGKIPSDAIIDPRGFYEFGALGAGVLLDVGIYRQGAAGLADAHLAGAIVLGDDVAAAGNQTILGHGTITLANRLKRIWELAGLATDPGGVLWLGASIRGAAIGTAGTVNFMLDYSVK